MGYRLYCRDDKNEVCYGKLYAYTDCDVDKLASFKYLLDIGKVEEEDAISFECDWNAEITLTAEEYRKFIDLYEKDYEAHSGEMYFRKGNYSKYPREKEQEELYQRDTEKIIEWV